ncbi:hypothetical protein SKAU_G00400600 [Synaphobranchus kaupii]|uniref:C-type lectin domain-containing protein n=1 Tax=Synaphobranchus kaupii TaxID=118154 RepID=A0A9Q1E8Z0_SYNKA|nr:hypothetical protein SKAU_G00400600 [Synaphobranchus kaupii]
MISTLYVNFKASKQCPQGFVLFNSHCYYFSLEKKSWNDSRKDCKERGADLVVIETEEKQGTWFWVDESQLDVGYWSDGEPNSYQGKNEDCVHTYRKKDALNNWNDARCNTSWYWVCEKPE